MPLLRASNIENVAAPAAMQRIPVRIWLVVEGDADIGAPCITPIAHAEQRRETSPQ